MSTAQEQPITAVKGEGKNQQKREFTPTQWSAMGKDKAGWTPAKPAEALLADKKQDGGDVALLEARERYAALFEKQPAANAKLETLEKLIAAELDRQNNVKPAPAPVPAPAPALPVAKPAAPTGDGDASKAASDAAKGPNAATA